ncbi:uncharacterized protein VNE69_06019 [Vairimorpha necatrix]|uniref:Uncharacterized protein n=1 Tax=Vairimorpha necatrix TaxID=6039 RepID=A0AAX4JCI2_9MICR
MNFLIVYSILKIRTSFDEYDSDTESNEISMSNDEETSVAYNKCEDCCPKIFYKEFDLPVKFKYLQQVPIMSDNIYLMILNQLSFPIKYKIDSTYGEIDKDDMEFEIFYDYVRGIYTGQIYHGKEEIIHKLLSSLARQSRDLIMEYSKLNFSVKPALRFKLYTYIFNSIDVKMDDKCTWNVKQVFKPRRYKKILENFKRFEKYIQEEFFNAKKSYLKLKGEALLKNKSYLTQQWGEFQALELKDDLRDKQSSVSSSSLRNGEYFNTIAGIGIFNVINNLGYLR